jgi:hypothetical protein
VPWAPELFSASALQSVLDKRRRDHLRSMPFFDGLLTGEVDALVGSFAGAPEVWHPLRGRIAGEAAFRSFVANTTAWMAERRADVEDVAVLLTDPRGVEEVVVHVDGVGGGRGPVPLGLAADHDEAGRIVALRLYFSPWALFGQRARHDAPLRPAPGLHAPDVVEELRARYGDVVVEPCTVTDDGRTQALEYTLIAPRETPRPGLAVRVPGDALRVYDDTEGAPR